MKIVDITPEIQQRMEKIESDILISVDQLLSSSSNTFFNDAYHRLLCMQIAELQIKLENLS